MRGADELAAQAHCTRALPSATDTNLPLALENLRRAQECPYNTGISHRRRACHVHCSSWPLTRQPRQFYTRLLVAR